ncbi:MAG: hypothetical protein ABJC39_10280, partial [Chloroflexota bacterium]
MRSPLAMVRGRSPAAGAQPPAWPAAAIEADTFRVGDQLCGGFELAPLNLELMADAEREATLDNLAALYDAIPGPFQLLSVPTDRTPAEHIAALKPAVDGSGERVFRPYVATYHEISATPTRPPRRTILVVDAATEAQLARTSDLIRRVAEERGLVAQAIDGASIAAIWSGIARSGATYTIRPGLAEGPSLVAALHLGRRWPAELRPGWLTGLLAIDGVATVSMRVRSLSRAEAMTFMTTRLRVVRAGERLAAERGEIGDVERERLDATAVAARRSVAAGAGRIYFVDTVLLLEAPDRAPLAERLETVRLEARSLGVEVETASLRIGQAWASALPGPRSGPICERNLDSASLAASLLHSASELYEPSGHLYGR